MIRAPPPIGALRELCAAGDEHLLDQEWMADEYSGQVQQAKLHHFTVLARVAGDPRQRIAGNRCEISGKPLPGGAAG